MSDTYRLLSDAGVYTPGIVRWAENLTTKDYEQDYANYLLRIGFLAICFPDAKAIVLSEIASGDYTVEKDKVIVEIGDRELGKEK